MYLRNWARVKESKVIFPEYGTVLVVGHNQTGGGSESSVAAGKTCLGEAICRAALGVNGRFSSLGRYSLDKAGKKDTYVDLRTELGGQPLRIELGYKTKELSMTGEGLRYTYGNSTPFERGHIDDTRLSLSQLINVTPELANWTVFVDGDKLKFSNLSQRESVTLLMQSLNQPPWDIYEAKAHKTHEHLKKERDTANRAWNAAVVEQQRAERDLRSSESDTAAALSDYNLRVKSLDDDLKAAKDQLEEKHAASTRIQDRQKEIKRTIKSLEAEAAEANHALEIQLGELEGVETSLRQRKDDWVEKRSDVSSKLRQAQVELDELKSEPDVCSKCGKPWDKKHSVNEIRESKEKVTKLKEALEEIETKLDRARERLTGASEDVKAMRGKIKALGATEAMRDLSDAFDRNNTKLNSVLDTIRDLENKIERLKAGPNRTILDRAQGKEEERRAAATRAVQAVESTAATLAAANALVKVGQYTLDAFGPTGIPNLVLRDSIAPLNAISRQLSHVISRGTIKLKFSTSKELKSGVETPKLIIDVDNEFGCSDIAGSSKGEGGESNIIISETLNEVGGVYNRVAFRWYDEVVNSQDPVVRTTIFSYLRDLAKKHKLLIFIVDHHADAGRFADYTLVADKDTSGFTTYRW